jgi:hypothetical protein
MAGLSKRLLPAALSSGLPSSPWHLSTFGYYPTTWTSPIDYLLLHAPVVSRAQSLSCVHLLSLAWCSPFRSSLPLDIGGQKDTRKLTVITNGRLLCCPLHRPPWDNCGRMEKWTLGTVLLLWCIGAARPKAAPVSVCGVCRTLVPSHIKDVCRVLSIPLR